MAGKNELHPFGGARVPAIGQGTWNLEKDDEAEAVRAIRAGLDLGLVHVDTAELYGSGRVEEIVGEALEGRRDEVFLVSKVLPSHASRKGVVEACERSLKRLRTDRLDCYLLHWREAAPLAPTFEAFDELESAGKIARWGVSNFDVADLEEALSIAGPGRIACNQVLYHLEERTIELEILPWCERQRVALVGYSPFGSGDFPSPSSRGGRVLSDVAARNDATPRQVALAFLTRTESLLAIPKAGRVEHVRDNAGASKLTLPPDDVAALDAAFPVGKWRGMPTL